MNIESFHSKSVFKLKFESFILRTWQVECKNQLKPSLTRAVLKTFWYELFIMGILCFISELVLRLALSFVLDNFLSYFRYVLLPHFFFKRFKSRFTSDFSILIFFIHISL